MNKIDLKNAFPGQQKNEDIFVFLRRHPLSFLPFILITSFMVVALVVVLIIIIKLFPDITNGLGLKIIIAASSVYLLFIVSFFLVGWIDFYYDIHIVTNRRIIDIDQNGLFSRQINELTLDHIEDVSAKIDGVFPTFFNYGDVHIQTAGARANFTLDKIPYPRNVAALIVDLTDQAHKGIPEDQRRPTHETAAIIEGKIIPNGHNDKNRENSDNDRNANSSQTEQVKSTINTGEFI